MSELLNTIKLDEVWINYKTNVAIELAIKDNEKKEDKSVKEIVPKEYHNYLTKTRQIAFQTLDHGIIKSR